MAKRAKPSAPDLFEASEDYPRPLHTGRKRLGGWKLIATVASATVGVALREK